MRQKLLAEADEIVLVPAGAVEKKEQRRAFGAPLFAEDVVVPAHPARRA